MKQNKNNNVLMWYRILAVINTITVIGYMLFSEYEKKQPRFVKHVCQTVAADEEKGLIAFTCLED